MSSGTTITTPIPPMSAPVRDGAATRRRLIDAGYELFLRHGFHGVGLDQVLRHAGVSKQTFYNHFESKDELALEVLTRRSEDEARSLRATVDRIGGADPRARLEALWDVLGEWFTSPGFGGCIFITAAAEFPSPHDPAHVAAAEHVRKTTTLIEELAAAAGATHPKELAERLMMLIDGAVIARHVCGNERAADIARDAARAVVAKYVAA